MARKTVRVGVGDTVEFSVFGMAPQFTVTMETGDPENTYQRDSVILIIKDQHGAEVMRVTR